MPNLYGDVLSDVAAQITGSVGLAGSANIGSECAMFEAIHGSAPRRAGQNVANLGQEPSQLKAVRYRGDAKIQVPKYERKAPKTKELEGVDLFVHWHGTEADALAPLIQAINGDDAALSMITNRGIKVWPNGFPETFCTDHWRCRFKNPKGGLMPKERIVDLLKAAAAQGIDVVKTENLYRFDGTPSYSLGQGQ